MTKLIRQIRVDGNVAYVPISRGVEAIIDADDVSLVEGYAWHANPDAKTFYAQANQGKKPNRTTIRMHRLLLNCPPGAEVDHIDMNGLNNRRANLRVVTKSQNQMNRPAPSGTSSGFKGVSWHKKTKKWYARIKVNKKSFSLGYHKTPEAAHAAYREACSRLHGEFGRTE